MSKEEYSFLLQKLYPKESFWANSQMTIDEKMIEVCSWFGLARDPKVVIGEAGSRADEWNFQRNLARALKIVPQKFAQILEEKEKFDKSKSAISSTLLIDILDQKMAQNDENLHENEENCQNFDENEENCQNFHENEENLENVDKNFPGEISIIKKPRLDFDKNNSTTSSSSCNGDFDEEFKSQFFRLSVIEKLNELLDDDQVEYAEIEENKNEELNLLQHIKGQIAKGRDGFAKTRQIQNKNGLPAKVQVQIDDPDLV